MQTMSSGSGRPTFSLGIEGAVRRTPQKADGSWSMRGTIAGCHKRARETRMYMVTLKRRIEVG